MARILAPRGCDVQRIIWIISPGRVHAARGPTRAPRMHIRLLADRTAILRLLVSRITLCRRRSIRPLQHDIERELSCWPVRPGASRAESDRLSGSKTRWNPHSIQQVFPPDRIALATSVSRPHSHSKWRSSIPRGAVRPRTSRPKDCSPSVGRDLNGTFADWPLATRRLPERQMRHDDPCLGSSMQSRLRRISPRVLSRS